MYALLKRPGRAGLSRAYHWYCGGRPAAGPRSLAVRVLLFKLAIVKVVIHTATHLTRRHPRSSRPFSLYCIVRSVGHFYCPPLSSIVRLCRFVYFFPHSTSYLWKIDTLDLAGLFLVFLSTFALITSIARRI